MSEGPAAGLGVSATGVTRSFAGRPALGGVDFTAPYGQVTGLVGPNGAGKTTLLLILATLLIPDAGTVRVAGHDPVREPAAVRPLLGWVPDVFGVYDNLTVAEFLRFAAATYRIGPEAARTRTAELLELVGLGEATDAPVHVLSRGQKQRLGIARALVHRPQVLLLDEPAAGLDPRSRAALRLAVRDLAGQGVAVVLSSHVLTDLEQTADRVVFLDGGRSVGEQWVDPAAQTSVRQSWRVRSLDPPSLLAALHARGYAHSAATPLGVEVELDSEAAAAGLLAELVADRVPVSSLAPIGSSLEAAFLSMTGSAG